MIEAHGHDELISLVGDLYGISEANRNFLHARYSIGSDPFEPYRIIFDDSTSPDLFLHKKPVQVDRAKAAAADCIKAVGDLLGKTVIMIYHIERGTAFSIDHGDIGEAFYRALEERYEWTIQKVRRLPKESQPSLKKRLKDVIASARGIGRGCPDNLAKLFSDAFGGEE
ncbi:MAG: hypothetical protein HY815_01725 [Candidatus Riflebacteria bacterium]|nr:hypothetical protein [Candidatus Riflebacteria bacterium]